MTASSKLNLVRGGEHNEQERAQNIAMAHATGWACRQGGCTRRAAAKLIRVKGVMSLVGAERNSAATCGLLWVPLYTTAEASPASALGANRSRVLRLSSKIGSSLSSKILLTLCYRATGLPRDADAPVQMDSSPHSPGVDTNAERYRSMAPLSRETEIRHSR
jgi:hypothetical protein